MQNQLAQYSFDIGSDRKLDNGIRAAVKGILSQLEMVPGQAGGSLQRTPSLETLETIVSGLELVLFPDVHAPGRSPQALSRQLRLSLSQLGLEMRHAFSADAAELTDRAAEKRIGTVLEQLVARLPELRRLLQADANAAHNGDPSSRSLLEVLLGSPGLRAMLHHRIAHELERLEVPLIPRMLAYLAKRETGIDIHPAASIGEGCFIDHGTGVVIGETASIGRNARIYQGVTLGARRIPMDEQGRALRGQKRHPQLGDDVTVYSGASVLGPVEIGSGSVIGGNVWLTHSVEPGSRVFQRPPRTSRFTDGAGI